MEYFEVGKKERKVSTRGLRRESAKVRTRPNRRRGHCLNIA
jgi:hypothetical protein